MSTKLFLLLVLLNTDIIIVYWYCFQLENVDLICGFWKVF